MPILIVPGAFTRPSSFARLALRLGAQVVARPPRLFAQLQRGGVDAVGAALDEAISNAPDDGTPLVLIGHSMGGLLSLRASLRHRIDGQVLLMPAPPEGLFADLARTFARNPITAAKLGTLALSSVPVRFGPFTPPPGLYTAAASRAVMRRGSAHRADESWSALLELACGSSAAVEPATVPTLVVGGRQDGLVRPERVRALARQLGADHLELDVAHNFSEEPAGEIVEEAVEHWLRERSLTPT